MTETQPQPRAVTIAATLQMASVPLSFLISELQPNDNDEPRGEMKLSKGASCHRVGSIVLLGVDDVPTNCVNQPSTVDWSTISIAGSDSRVLRSCSSSRL